MLLLALLLAGLLIGFVQGGKASSLSLIKLRFGFLIVAALAMQVLLIPVTMMASGALTQKAVVAYAVSYLLVITFLLFNRQIRWIEGIAGGLSLNLLALLSREGIVLSSPVLAASAYPGAGAPYTKSALWFLGDVFSLPVGGAFSAGDAMIALALLLISREMLLAQSIRPQVIHARYQPKHLIGTNLEGTRDSRFFA